MIGHVAWLILVLWGREASCTQPLVVAVVVAVAAPGRVLALGQASTSASALVPAWASAPASASAALASAPAVPAAVHNEAAAAAAAAVVPVRARVPSCWGAWAPPGTLGAAPHPACGLTVRAARLLWRFYGACRVHEPILCRTCLLAVGVSVVVEVAASEYWVLGRVPVRWGPQTAGVEPCPLLRQRRRRRLCQQRGTTTPANTQSHHDTCCRLPPRRCFIPQAEDTRRTENGEAQR